MIPQTLEAHDISDIPDMGTLNVTDWLSDSVSDTPGTRDATHLKTDQDLLYDVECLKATLVW